MEGIMLLCGLLGALAVAFGIARLVAWVIDRREEQGIKAIRDASFVAQAQAEFLPTPSRLRHLELEASKRGDLLAAADLAEQADRDYSIALLDQQDTHCADDFPGYAEAFLDDSATGKPEVRHA